MPRSCWLLRLRSQLSALTLAARDKMQLKGEVEDLSNRTYSASVPDAVEFGYCQVAGQRRLCMGNDHGNQEANAKRSVGT